MTFSEEDVDGDGIRNVLKGVMYIGPLQSMIQRPSFFLPFQKILDGEEF